MGTVMRLGICRLRAGNTSSAPSGVWWWVVLLEQYISITLSRTFMYIFISTLLEVHSERSRDSIVCIATRYRLEGLGIESRCGQIFRTYPDWFRGPPSLLYNGYQVFPGGKGGRGVMLTTHPLLVPRLRKSWANTSTHPIGPPGPVTGFPLPLPFYIVNT